MNDRQAALKLADVMLKEHARFYGTLASIADALDSREWDADTLDYIAELVRGAGFTIRDPEENPD